MVGIYCASAVVDRKTLLKLSRQAESASGINGREFRNNIRYYCDNRHGQPKLSLSPLPSESVEKCQ